MAALPSAFRVDINGTCLETACVYGTGTVCQCVPTTPIITLTFGEKFVILNLKLKYNVITVLLVAKKEGTRNFGLRCQNFVLSKISLIKCKQNITQALARCYEGDTVAFAATATWS
jgi:hypothetical protein